MVFSIKRIQRILLCFFLTRKTLYYNHTANGVKHIFNGQIKEYMKENSLKKTCWLLYFHFVIETVFSPTMIPMVTIITSTEGAKELRVNPAVARAPPVTIATRLLNLLVIIPASGAEINIEILIFSMSLKYLVGLYIACLFTFYWLHKGSSEAMFVLSTHDEWMHFKRKIWQFHFNLPFQWLSTKWRDFTSLDEIAFRSIWRISYSQRTKG